MGEYQQILLDMLKEITSVCEELGIKYFLVEGTCLGAVRHKGFIPWDDDIDIAIFAEDYEKFVTEVPRKLKNNYFLQEGFVIDDATRIYDNKIDIKVNVVDSDMHHPWIDVLILCGMPDNIFFRKLHYFLIWLSLKIFKASNLKNVNKRKRGLLESLIIEIISKTKISHLIDTKVTLKNLKKYLFRKQYNNSNYTLAFPSWYFEKEIMPKEVYGDGVMVPFETIKARVPQKYDEYLTRLYGDYMQLPPESERVGKHLISIVKFE